MLTNTTVLGILQRQKIPAIPLNLTLPVMEFSIPQSFQDRRYVRVYDVVHLYAKGIDKTIQKNCKYISREDKKQLRNCVKANLASNMKFIENDGTVKIKLDENGDAYARWRIYQNQNGTTALVASYDETEDPKLRLSMEIINWSMFSHFQHTKFDHSKPKC